MGCTCSDTAPVKNFAYTVLVENLQDFDPTSLSGTLKERDKLANNIVIAARMKDAPLVEIALAIGSSNFTNFNTWYINYGNGEFLEEGKRVLRWVENYLISTGRLKFQPVITTGSRPGKKYKSRKIKVSELIPVAICPGA